MFKDDKEEKRKYQHRVSSTTKVQKDIYEIIPPPLSCLSARKAEQNIQSITLGKA